MLPVRNLIGNKSQQLTEESESSDTIQIETKMD